MKRVITILILFGILLPSFSLAQARLNFVLQNFGGQVGTVKLPENVEQAKEMGKGFLSIFPGFLKNTYQVAFNVGNWFYQKAVVIWDSYIFPWLDKYVLQKIEKRKPMIEEEFKKESKEMKKEVKTEVPRVSKTLWQKFKELIE